jgi:hypothetical protein
MISSGGHSSHLGIIALAAAPTVFAAECRSISTSYRQWLGEEQPCQRSDLARAWTRVRRAVKEVCRAVGPRESRLGRP